MRILLVCCAALALTAGLSTATAGNGDKNKCKNGGWQTVTRSDGSNFKNEDKCVEYIRAGGVLQPKAPDLTLSPGTFTGTTPSGTKNYNYIFFNSAAPQRRSGVTPHPVNPTPQTQTFTVSNDGTGTSQTLGLVVSGDNEVVLSNNNCQGHALPPSGTCTFDATFNGPICSGSTFVDIGPQSIGDSYIRLTAFSRCH